MPIIVRHYKASRTSFGRAFAFIAVYGLAIGIMGLVSVFLMIRLINSDISGLRLGLSLTAIPMAFSLYLYAAYKIFCFFGKMFSK